MTNRLILMIGDWLALLLFVFIGQRDHQITGPGALPSLLLTTFAIALPWTLAAAVLGAYRFDDGLTLQRWLGRAMNAWLVAAPLGLVLRALLRGQSAIAVPFMLVMLGLGGLFMLAWRAGVFYVIRRRNRAAA
jgi:hypothetical protein